MKLYITALATTLVVFSGSVLAEVMNGNQMGTSIGQGTSSANTQANGWGFPNNWTPNTNNMPMPWNNGNTQGYSMPWGKGGNSNTQNYPMQMQMPMQMQTPQMPMTNYFSPQQVQELMMQQQALFRKQQQAQYQAFLKQLTAMQAQSKQAIPTTAPTAPFVAPTTKSAGVPDVIVPATPKVAPIAVPTETPKAAPDVIVPATPAPIAAPIEIPKAAPETPIATPIEKSETTPDAIATPKVVTITVPTAKPDVIAPVTAPDSATAVKAETEDAPVPSK